MIRPGGVIPVFHLSGGIGNQLFGYAAGKAYSKANSIPVMFDLSDAGKGFTNHGSSIQALSLEINIAPSQSRLRRLENRVVNKFDRIFNRLTSKKLASFTNYRSNEIGYDAALLDKRFIRNFRGYYQSWKYVEAVHESFPPRELILNSPSEWFRKLSELALVEKPIFIHVRRGTIKNFQIHMAYFLQITMQLPLRGFVVFYQIIQFGLFQMTLMRQGFYLHQNYRLKLPG